MEIDSEDKRDPMDTDDEHEQWAREVGTDLGSSPVRSNHDMVATPVRTSLRPLPVGSHEYPDIERDHQLRGRRQYHDDRHLQGIPVRAHGERPHVRRPSARDERAREVWTPEEGAVLYS